MARWLSPLLRARPGTPLAETLTRRPGGSLGEALDASGVDGLLRGVLDRFLAGVVLEDEGSTAQAYALLLLATFLRGTPGLPERGMQALPAQLARPIGDRVRLHVEVGALETSSGAVLVHTSVGSWRARQVVVAVDATASAGLLGDLAPADTPGTKGVVTCWFAADTAPHDSRSLFVDARRRPAGPLVNAAVVSNPAPSYAPRGRHLVQASALLGPGRPVPTEDDVRRHAGDLFGADPSRWELLVRHEVPHALPDQPAPLVLRKHLRVAERVVVAGDHRDTASIQGALVSGQRAAAEVARRL